MSNITQNGGIIYIQQSGNDIQYQSNSTSGSWTNITSFPVTIVNSNPVQGNILTVSLFTNLSIGLATGYFICGSSYITFDGTGKTITIANVSAYLGLIQNGSFTTNGYHAITVKNINSTATNSFLISQSGGIRAGWICGPYFGQNIKNINDYVPIIIDNCSNSGIVNNSATINSGYANGGICGSGFCSNGVGNISNCTNSGVISGNSAGGICGFNTGNTNGNVSITNCSNSGVISGNSAGGICGSYTGNINGNVSITNCSNSGVISGISAGGICGSNTGSTNGIVSISICSNSGVISGRNSGGICGVNAGSFDGTVSISICSNSGVIIGQFSGGITGSFFGAYSNKLCSIINCYNTGTINGNNAGGITGADIGHNDNVSYIPKILIKNCYSLGNIASTCGGICGGTSVIAYISNIPIVNITDSGSQYISITLPIKSSIILTNVYNSLTNSWSDTNASSALSGALSIYRNSRLYKYYSNFGEVWYSNQNNTPFSFTTELNTVPRRQRRD
jgi:hypothetical protein